MYTFACVDNINSGYLYAMHNKNYRSIGRAQSALNKLRIKDPQRYSDKWIVMEIKLFKIKEEN